MLKETIGRKREREKESGRKRGSEREGDRKRECGGNPRDELPRAHVWKEERNREREGVIEREIGRKEINRFFLP